MGAIVGIRDVAADGACGDPVCWGPDLNDWRPDGAEAARLDRLYNFVTGDEDARVCKDIPPASCNDQPRNFFAYLIANTLNKVADEISSAKLVLPWMLGTLGAPAAFTGFLVPIRESGVLLPQMAVAAFVRRLPRRLPMRRSHRGPSLRGKRTPQSGSHSPPNHRRLDQDRTGATHGVNEQAVPIPEREQNQRRRQRLRQRRGPGLGPVASFMQPVAGRIQRQ